MQSHENKLHSKQFSHDAETSGLSRSAPLVLSFTGTMLLSALLLFFVQPLFAKMALPLLGGSSGVWNTAMVFFQAVLLLGYLYAHILTKHLAFKAQILTHGFVLATAMFFLPIALPAGWEAPADGTPTIWLLMLMAVALGAPFFALSANAPLLQKWFSYSNHKNANDPYFLYAASNLGSLASLLSYPVLIEPFFRLHGQSYAWAVGFIALFLMILGSGLLALRQPGQVEESENSQASSEIISWKRRATWVGFALVPSSLMLGVTAHLTANVASTPFLWVLPLALYLLTFVFAFSSRPLISPKLIANLFPFVLFGILFLLTMSQKLNYIAALAGHLAGFFLITLMCHNRLAADRPSTDNLTGFYFYMSLGGVIGGAITALAAPVIFNDVYEYHLMIVIAALVATGQFLPQRQMIARTLTVPTLLVTAAIAFVMYSDHLPSGTKPYVFIVATAICLTSVIALRKAPVALCICLLATAVLGKGAEVIFAKDGTQLIYAERSFFGTIKVMKRETEDGPIHRFVHGNTDHNIELQSAEARGYPLAYYEYNGTFGQTVRAVRVQKSSLAVGVIGLGAGAMACHAKPGERWKYYEIDPAVVEMARNPALFSYVSDCAGDAPIITGDARLTMQNETANSFDLIMVDAFSSNVIPAHLVTVEALNMYRSKLNEGGIVFFHVSNRNLDVASVVANVANELGLATRRAAISPDKAEPYTKYVNSSEAIIVGDNEEHLDSLLAQYPDWKPFKGSETVGVWQDDYSHIIGAMVAKQAQKKNSAENN